MLLFTVFDTCMKGPTNTKREQENYDTYLLDGIIYNNIITPFKSLVQAFFTAL